MDMNLFFANILTDSAGNPQWIAAAEDYFKSVQNVVDFSISCVFLLFFTVFLSLKIRRAWVWIIYLLMDVLFLASSVFQLQILQLVSLLVLISATTIFLIVNSGILRQYVAKPLKASKSSSSVKQNTAASMDKEKLIQNVVTAVNWLSANKVGALITFERETPLDEFIKSGTIINCPFTPEIVETIFFEGTRLHDGAIIIKGDTIVAAAVYYPPSTKAIIGKFGARHRAALGISEITDAVTIVVSEETGRISIAHGGIMDNLKTDEFEKVFRNTIL